MQTDHWNSRTIHFLKPVLAQGTKSVRIATGFFTVEGYDLIREHLADKRVYLMVGFDEMSRERLRQKLIDDIMLHLSTWDGPNRRTAVLALVEQLKKRRFYIVEQPPGDWIDARLRNRDHAKIFIIDDALAVVGSGNLTVSGLRYNSEGLTQICDEPRVRYWVERFNYFWEHPDTVDLTQALLEALLRWLELHAPYDIYLKTIEALIGEDDTPPPRSNYKMPVQYQMVVIERVLRQLKDWGGAMLVASTGLGKTVMATHIAYRLREAHEIYFAVIFAPLQVHPNWELAMESAGVACKVLTRDLLDQPLNKNSHAVRQMVQQLERANNKFIIFVDESHHFKNMLRAKDGTPRHSFKRLFDAVNERGAKIVLLTATPFAKDVADLNNQLYLLPHHAPPIYLTADGQQAIPGVIDDQINPDAWKVQKSDRTFEQFINLPVSTVISTSQVAKDFAVHEPAGDYVMFGENQRWIPRIEIKKIKVPVPLEGPVSRAIRDRYFRHERKRFQVRGEWQMSETTIESQAEIAWASSPPALLEVVQKTIDGTYSADKLQWLRDREAQTAVLTPILERLAAMSYRQDEKFWTLCKILQEAKAGKRKVVIFTERHATAVYLAEGLTQEIPDLQVASVLRRSEQGYELKDFAKEVLPLIAAFAPEANEEIVDMAKGHPSYDVFVTTDAYSNGVNLQDAEVVISYDLAWTPDTIIQRAGRVLRFWREPRLVSLYIFVGDFQEDIEGSRATAGVENRLRKLTARSREAQQFSELPVFPEGDDLAYDSLGALSRVTIEDLGLADITKIEEFTGVSGYLCHITELKQNQAYAATIPDDIASAMTYDGERHLLYLLLRYRRSYFWTLYDIKRDMLAEVKEDRLLNLIQCPQDKEIAPIDANVIEHHAQICRTKWLEMQTDVDPTLVERICALYLLPYKDQGDFGQMLQRSWLDTTRQN
jgi:superfamily II DNA or RNA helicase